MMNCVRLGSGRAPRDLGRREEHAARLMTRRGLYRRTSLATTCKVLAARITAARRAGHGTVILSDAFAREILDLLERPE